ncbi:MAG: pitrilysin family protein [Alphaproteobacteria bacterium]
MMRRTDATLRALAGRLCRAAPVLLLVLLVPVAARATTVERVISPQGIEAWLVEEQVVPLITIEFAFRGGAALDPAGKEGLAMMTLALLSEGAGDLDSHAFKSKLDDRAIHLGFSSGMDDVGGTLQTLSKNRDLAFDFLRLALTEPRFDEGAVERVRRQVLVSLARAEEDPGDIAHRAWKAAIFPEHPYGRDSDGTKESIAAIEIDDLRAFVVARFARDNLVIGVVGDVTPDELGPILDSAFGALPPEGASHTVPEVSPKTTGEVIVIEKPIPQSVVVFGKEGIRRDDPDFYAAYVMNYILGGGGFSSRLTIEIREKRGLAYSVYSYLAPMDHAALYVGGVATQNERAGESIALVRAEFERLYESGVSEEELANAKSYLTGSFPLRFDNSQRIAGMLVSMQVDDLGIDYFDRRNSYIEAVGLDDIERVARRLLKPGDLTFVVVGEPRGLDTGS